VREAKSRESMGGLISSQPVSRANPCHLGSYDEPPVQCNDF